MLRALLITLTLATPAAADVAETVRDHILPGYAAFDAAAAALATATATCDAEVIKPAFHAAYDAWMGVAHLRFGPVETNGRALAIAFWPDPKSLGAKAQRALMLGDPALLEPARFAEQSVAARGLAGLERLLYPSQALPAEPCPLIRATAADLASMASAISTDWQTSYADTLLTAGNPTNTTYLTPVEARQALFTQLASGLEFTADSRIGRPMGTFDTPRPERAEARASARSLINIRLSLKSLRQMVATLDPNATKTQAGFDHAIDVANALDDPTLAGVSDPAIRLKIEILQQSISTLRSTILTELAPAMGVGIGFNAQDGD